MNIDESEPRARSPMTQEPVLDVLGLERLLQKRIVLKIDHAKRQVLARTPISFGLSQLRQTQGRPRNRRPCDPISTQCVAEALFRFDYRRHFRKLLCSGITGKVAFDWPFAAEPRLP